MNRRNKRLLRARKELSWGSAVFFASAFHAGVAGALGWVQGWQTQHPPTPKPPTTETVEIEVTGGANGAGSPRAPSQDGGKAPNRVVHSASRAAPHRVAADDARSAQAPLVFRDARYSSRVRPLGSGAIGGAAGSEGHRAGGGAPGTSGTSGTGGAGGAGDANGADGEGSSLSSRAHVHCDEHAMADLFPAEAKHAGIRHAMIRFQLHVDKQGKITTITPLEDPGLGLTQAAVRGLRTLCYGIAARDQEGKPVSSVLPSFKFHFVQE